MSLVSETMARHRLPSDVKPSLYAACATVTSRSDNKYETAIILNQRTYDSLMPVPRLGPVTHSAADPSHRASHLRPARETGYNGRAVGLSPDQS